MAAENGAFKTRVIIETPSDFINALQTRTVAEVSPKLFGTITDPTYGTLTNTLRTKAWVSSSANLYDFLLLNYLYQPNQNQTNQSSINLDTLVSQSTMDGLGRIVGLPQIGNMAVTSPLLIFKEDQSSDVLGDTTVPNYANFGELINQYKPTTSKPIPSKVLEHLQKAYGRISASGYRTPFEAYSRFSGLSTWRLENYGANTITVPISDPAKEISSPAIYRIYKKALDAVCPDGYSLGMTIDTANFFKNFANSLLDNPPSLGWQFKLEVGVRALLYTSYSVSPLWSSFGIGYRNTANPLVGLPSSSLTGSEIYAGQEFLVNNTQWSSNENIAVQLAGSGSPQGTQSGNYLETGWFAMAPPVILRSGIVDQESLPTSVSNNTWQGKISGTGTILIFPDLSLSSNTVDASTVKKKTLSLTPSSEYDVLTGRTLSERGGLMGNILPKSFALYIDTAGGIDKVTGSRFNDVIIGSPESAAHGELTVNSGRGNDLIDPGRGGGLVYTGTGRDSVVFERGDLFGQTILMDFTYKRDSLVIPKDILYSGLGTSELILGDANDPLNSKTLLLSGTSTLVWHRSSIKAV